MTTSERPFASPGETVPNGRARRVLHWLLEPQAALTDEQERRQARLLAGFMFVLTLLTLVGTLVPALLRMVNPLQDPFSYVMGGTTLLFTAAYALSRTRRYTLGAILTVMALSALPYTLALTREDFDPQRVPSIFGWLILALIFGSIFLNERGVLVVGVANVIALVAFPFLVPQVSHQTLFPPLSLLIVVTVLVLVAVRNRNLLERYRLADLSAKNQELQSLHNTLERRVRRRTADLQRRLTQLRAAAEIASSITGTLALDELLDQVANRLQKAFGLYYVGVFLVDEASGYAVLRAGTGVAGQKMLAEGHKLAIGGTSMIGWATAEKKPRIALDVGQDAVRFDNPHLPLTRSELAIPLIFSDQVLGALSIQSKEAAAFDEDDITVLQGIADSLAAAIHNARLFQQVQKNLEEIDALHRSYLARAWSEASPTDLDYQFQADDEAPAGEDEAVSAIDVPLTLREQVIGHLTLEASKGEWTPDELAFIEAVTNQAAIALENARLLEETRRKAEAERIVSEISSKLWGTTDVETILRTGIRELGRALNAAEGIIQLEMDE